VAVVVVVVVVVVDQALSNKHYAPVRCKVLKTADDTNAECANNLMSSFAKGKTAHSYILVATCRKTAVEVDLANGIKLGQAKIIKSLINPTSYFERERRNLLINVRIPTHKSKGKNTKL
jgi:hypothetical protein